MNRAMTITALRKARYKFFSICVYYFVCLLLDGNRQQVCRRIRVRNTSATVAANRTPLLIHGMLSQSSTSYWSSRSSYECSRCSYRNLLGYYVVLSFFTCPTVHLRSRFTASALSLSCMIICSLLQRRGPEVIAGVLL